MKPENDLFTAEQLGQLEIELIDTLRQQGLIIDEIKLIGLKGSGYHATVFSVLIDDVHHVLKVYREPIGFEREAKHLHKVIPTDRLLFMWRAEDNRYGLNFVIIEVPDGSEMSYLDLTPTIATRMARATISLHRMRSRHKVSMRALGLRFEQLRPRALAHAPFFAELDGVDLNGEIDRAIEMTETKRDILKVRRARSHGDLWWANVIVAAEDVYLVDWEQLRTADFCEDLAKFRILFHIVRNSQPSTIWDTNPPQNDVIEEFIETLLKAYESRFRNRNIRFRYGYYCWLYGLRFFSEFFNEEKHATAEALAMLQTGRREFQKYCVAQPTE